jgi:hypothetical protein
MGLDHEKCFHRYHRVLRRVMHNRSDQKVD